MSNEYKQGMQHATQHIEEVMLASLARHRGQPNAYLHVFNDTAIALHDLNLRISEMADPLDELVEEIKTIFPGIKVTYTKLGGRN